jgi:hypothetical protein
VPAGALPWWLAAAVPKLSTSIAQVQNRQKAVHIRVAVLTGTIRSLQPVITETGPTVRLVRRQRIRDQTPQMSSLGNNRT